MSGQQQIRAQFIFYLIMAMGMAFVIYIEYELTKEILIKSQEGILTIREDKGSGPKGSCYYGGNIDSTNVLIKTKEDVKIGSSYPVMYDPNELAYYAKDDRGPFFGFRFGNKRESTFDIHLRHRGPIAFWWMVLMTVGLLIAAYVQFRRIKRIRIVRKPSRK